MSTKNDSTIDDKNLAFLEAYLKRGWALFPCGADKKPLTKNGFKDATLDPAQLRAWYKQFPSAIWGMPTGPKKDGGSGLVVIDIDHHVGKPNGFETWDALRNEYSEPLETVTVKTGGGGRQLYFKYPDNGHVIKSGTDVLGPSIDVRARGGYVIVPPSKTQAVYTFELAPKDYQIAELPQWIMTRVNGTLEAAETAQAAQPDKPKKQKIDGRKFAQAASALNAMKKERAENYDDWVKVGMALFELGDYGLTAWDNWSKQSDKYKPGECSKKWLSFNHDLTAANQITFASLLHWAAEDGAQPFIKPAPKHATPDDYSEVMDAMGFQFSLNDMNDMVYINGAQTSDITGALVEYQLRNYGYKSERDTKITIYKKSYDARFHPIKNYLSSLVLEARYDPKTDTMKPVDHIGRLCEFFNDRDGVFETVLKKWLVGAVGRVMGERPGQQHPMIVLDGPQGIGKSRFAWWLGSPLPEFYIQAAIKPDDKDFFITLCSKFVWEVEELDATIRRADIAALKAFISKEYISVRKPYGHDAINKPATASFIGTINNSGGFLNDPTGSRRFRVVTLTSIDWAYEAAIDVNQIWAQAVNLYELGERWTLDADQNARMMDINSRYDVDDPIHFDLVSTYNINPQETEQHTATAEIIHQLKTDGKITGGNDNQHAQRIANILTRMGCEKKQIRVNGQPVRVWLGVWARGGAR